jgi:hypothetical protein
MATRKRVQQNEIAKGVRELLAQRRALIFLPKHNSHGKRDVTGAFRPEAKRIAKLFHGSRVIEFDNRCGFVTRRHEVLGALRTTPSQSGPFDTVIFLCHGWTDGIQAGFKRRDAAKLATAIRYAVRRADVRVPLYCCSTGDDEFDDPFQAVASPYHDGCGPGEGSFADKLRDRLCELGAVTCSIMGHTCEGHTTRNRHALRFEGMGSSYGGIGGFRLVAPGSKLWRPWCDALKVGDFRFRFPYMTVANVHEELSAYLK